MDKDILYKVVAFIGRDELDFLDKIVKDIYFSTGKKVPRAELIKEIIHLSRNSQEFKQEIIEDLEAPNKEVHHA